MQILTKCKLDQILGSKQYLWSFSVFSFFGPMVIFIYLFGHLDLVCWTRFTSVKIPPLIIFLLPLNLVLILFQALRAISPATTKMLLKTLRDANTSQELHIGAIYCSAKSIQVICQNTVKSFEDYCSMKETE